MMRFTLAGRFLDQPGNPADVFGMAELIADDFTEFRYLPLRSSKWTDSDQASEPYETGVTVFFATSHDDNDPIPLPLKAPLIIDAHHKAYREIKRPDLLIWAYNPVKNEDGTFDIVSVWRFRQAFFGPGSNTENEGTLTLIDDSYAVALYSEGWDWNNNVDLNTLLDLEGIAEKFTAERLFKAIALDFE